jgi:nucleotide-binding universal stress UspA family protein
MTVRRILVPIDFSEHSKDALEYAVDLGSHFKAELILIYVVETVGYPADLGYGQVAIPQLEKEMTERGRKELQRLADTFIGEKLKVKLLVQVGRPFLEIIKTAKTDEVDMIIIATHGHTGVEHILFGSTAEKVVRKAHCPVLVVR